MRKKKGFYTGVVFVTVVLMAYLFYSRAMTLQQLYPGISAERCTEIRGYHKGGNAAGFTEFTVEKGSEEWNELCELFYGRSYRRSLRSLLPKGTRYRRLQPGDFQWDVYFYFDGEGTTFPDGRGSAVLHIQNWYGQLDIRLNGEQPYTCCTEKQEDWAKEVWNIIQ